MNTNIPLSGVQFDLGRAAQTGMGLAAAGNQMQTANALANLYKTQGANIMAGDQNALNMLAQTGQEGLMAALGVQGQQLDQQATRQRMAFGAEEMAMRREAARAATEAELAAKAATLTAEQLAAEREALSGALQGGAFFYQKQDKAGYEAFLRSKGIDPAAYPFEAFPAHAADVEGVLEALDKFAPPEPTGPLSSAGKLQADINAGILPPGTTATPDTVINMGGGSDKQVFDAIAAGNERAASALVGLNGLAEAKKALDGGAIVGFEADKRLWLAKLGSYIGITGPAAIENTETFRAAIAPQVSAMIKATVGSANISNADREFAEKAAAGSIQLDEASIKRMIGIMEKMGREAIRLNNAKVDKVYPDNGKFERERALFLIPEPSKVAGPDDGTGIGTIEDGFRYIGGDSSTPDAWEPVQ